MTSVCRFSGSFFHLARKRPTARAFGVGINRPFASGTPSLNSIARNSANFSLG